MEAQDKATEILQGTLELLIPRTLATDEKHATKVAEWIHTPSGDALDVEEGALYPALHRLGLRGLLAAQWDVSANNRRAKYYRAHAERPQEASRSDRVVVQSSTINRVLEAI
jgi:DNA-binding PadR family transcriptional regulator